MLGVFLYKKTAHSHSECAVCVFAILERALIGNIRFQLTDGNTNLLHGITVTDSYAVISLGSLIAHGLEINGDAKRCANAYSKVSSEA